MASLNFKHAISVVLALAAGFMVFSLYKPSESTTQVAPRAVYATGELVPVLTSITNTLTKLTLEHEAPKRVQVQLTGATALAKHVRSLSGLIKKIGSSSKAVGQLKKSSFTTNPTKSSSSTFPYRQIISLSDDRCLDAGTYIKLDGVKLYGCNQGLPQGFWITIDGMIRHSSGHCLQSRDSEQAVRFVVCDSKDMSQHWELLRAGEVMRYGTPFRNVQSRRCLDHQYDSLVATDCSDMCSQLWMANHIQGSKQAAKSTTAVLQKKPPMETKEMVLCWSIFEAASLATLGVAVNNTWARDCDTFVAFSTEPYPGLDVVVLEGGPNNPLWSRIQQAWMYLYAHHYNTADWFFKADDDSYVVVPYLREFIGKQEPNKLAHYGRRFLYSGLKGNENMYVSGGSGLLVNRLTLGKLGAAVEKDPNVWAGPATGPADLLMSRTLNKLGALPQDTRDSEGRHVFIALGLEMEYGSSRASSPDMWLWKYSPDARDGKNCCSKRWITAHYFKPNQMYSLYKMQQLGCTTSADAFPFLHVPKFTPTPNP
eukprot:m.7232 g.7232  ORF g.7232 m.7232 type:complete len:539 (+) comp4977_c0_seq2:197-1813(+)